MQARIGAVSSTTVADPWAVAIGQWPHRLPAKSRRHLHAAAEVLERISHCNFDRFSLKIWLMLDTSVQAGVRAT